MMPTESVSSTVPVRPDPRAQPPRLANQLLARHPFEVVVHATSLPSREDWTPLDVVRRNRIRPRVRPTSAIRPDAARYGEISALRFTNHSNGSLGPRLC